MVQPENLDSAVDDFIQLLNLDPTKVLRVSKHDKGNPINFCYLQILISMSLEIFKNVTLTLLSFEDFL